MAKNTEVSKIINLSAKMNTRSNNEVLDVDANQTGLELTYIQNNDPFYTKSITSRQGTQDIGGGVVNASTGASLVYDLHNISGTTGWTSLYDHNFWYDRSGYIIVNSGSQSVFSGKVYLRGHESSLANPELGYDMELSVWLNQVNANAWPASGVGGIYNNNLPSGIDIISLSNFYYDNSGLNPLRLRYNQTGFPSFNQDCKPDAISKTTIFNLGPYSGSGIDYSTALTEVSWQMYAPFDMPSGSVYYLKLMVNNTSGTTARSLEIQAITNTGTDYAPNVVEAQERLNSGAANYLYAGYNGPPKTYIDSFTSHYAEPSYALVDHPNADYVWSIPSYGSGAPPGVYDTRIWTNIPGNISGNWPGSTQAPTNAYLVSGTNRSTESPAFGNIMTVPSGIQRIDGAYCYLGVIGTGNGYTNWTMNKTNFPSDGYNVGYTCELCEISGTSPYTVTSVLATYSGNHIFNEPYTYVSPTNSASTFDPTFGSATQTQLDRVYALFPNTVIVNNTGNTQYLLKFKLYDFNTGAPLTDYVSKTQYRVVGPPGSQVWWYTFASPILLGLHATNSGTTDRFVCNQVIGSGDYFQQITGGYGATTNLACGLVSMATGNAITSIYDYRIGDQRTQEILYTQRDGVYSFQDYDPVNTRVTLYTGVTTGSGTGTHLSIDNNYKWSWSTFQGMAFGHQYSKSSGICWDQVYFDPSGNSMQLHGLRPEMVVAGGKNTVLPSGYVFNSGNNINAKPFDIIIATAMESGGFRSNEVIHFTGADTGFAGTGTNTIQLEGPYITGVGWKSIQNTGLNVSGLWQYNFDANSLGTYVFTTQPSGSVFFLANLINVSGDSIGNPLPNENTWDMGVGGGKVFLFDNSYQSQNSLQVPNAINYDQTYLLNQVNTPKFKKTIVYKNTMFGVGDTDNPSRLWFSEIQAPQIWGVDTNFYGYYDIDNDNGQEITGIEIFKDYLIIFKENSTYRASYTANPGNPLDIFQVSNTKGCLGIFTTVSTDYGVIGLNQFGPFLASYAGIENIGDEILPYYQNLDRTELIFAVAIHDPARQQIYWSISSAAESPDNQLGLVYSYAEKAWGVRQEGMWNVGARIGDVDNFSKYYIGDTYGQIKQINVGNADNDVLFVDTNGTDLSKNITLELETPWLNFENSQDLKQLKFVKINCDSSAQKLRVDVYFDQDDTTKKYSRYINMNVPVINRVCSLAGVCRTVKLVITSVGLPAQVKLNSLQFGYVPMGASSNIR